MLDTKNKEIANRSIKIDNLQKEVKITQNSRIKKNGKNDHFKKDQIDVAIQVL